MLTRRTVGVPGLLGMLCLLFWAFGFLVLGMHRGGFHLLVPVGAFLLLAQGVLRVNAADPD